LREEAPAYDIFSNDDSESLAYPGNPVKVFIEPFPDSYE
jgi:hypothetical protein